MVICDKTRFMLTILFDVVSCALKERINMIRLREIKLRSTSSWDYGIFRINSFRVGKGRWRGVGGQAAR